MRDRGGSERETGCTAEAEFVAFEAEDANTRVGRSWIQGHAWFRTRIFENANAARARSEFEFEQVRL